MRLLVSNHEEVYLFMIWTRLDSAFSLVHRPPNVACVTEKNSRPGRSSKTFTVLTTVTYYSTYLFYWIVFVRHGNGLAEQLSL